MESSNKQKVKSIYILINKTIYHFLIQLISNIILKDETKKDGVNERVKKYLDYINKKLIKSEDKKINSNYEKRNLKNIFNFIKMQNSKYAREIFENILIIVFSFGCNAKKQKTFGKYLFNNIENLKAEESQNYRKTKNAKNQYEISEWFNQDKFKFLFNDKSSIGKIVSPFKDLLMNDSKIQKLGDNKIVQGQPIFDILDLIYCDEEYYRSRNKFSYYLDRANYLLEERIEMKDINEKKDDETYTLNNISCRNSKISDYFFNSTFNKIGKSYEMGLIRSLFISAYIYHQNKNSPLMKFTEKSDKNKEFEIIPFEYNLSEAVIDDIYSRIILSPLRIEPKISIINLKKNIINKNGFEELSKVLIFNNNINCINNSYCTIQPFSIYLLNNAFGIFDNNSVEEINLSYNYLNEDSGEFLANMLSHLKNLKIINLSSNELKRGISPFLITLKNLYREGKTKLETLNLIKCELDDISYYELAELLK
jgi:hypothetical protein